MDYEGVWGPSYMEEVGACVYVCVCMCVCVYVLGHNGGEPVALLQVAPPAPHRPLLGTWWAEDPGGWRSSEAVAGKRAQPGTRRDSLSPAGGPSLPSICIMGGYVRQSV